LSPSELQELTVHGRLSDIGREIWKKIPHWCGKERSEIFDKLSFEISLPVIEGRKEFGEVYLLMVKEVAKYHRAIAGKDIFFAGAARTEEAIKQPEVFLLKNLFMPEEGQRIKGLDTVERWIHQLWVLKLIHESIGCSKVEDGWWIEQGSYHQQAASIFYDSAGNPWGLFFEFQLISSEESEEWGKRWEEGFKEAMFEGGGKKKVRGRIRGWMRPDIVIFKGKFRYRGEVVERGSLKEQIFALGECKDKSFDRWERDIQEQIIHTKEFSDQGNSWWHP
jgi:hypothetical protein